MEWSERELDILNDMLEYLKEENIDVDEELVMQIKTAITKHIDEYRKWEKRDVLDYDGCLNDIYRIYNDAVYKAKDAMDILYVHPKEASITLFYVSLYFKNISDLAEERFKAGF